MIIPNKCNIKYRDEQNHVISVQKELRLGGETWEVNYNNGENNNGTEK